MRLSNAKVRAHVALVLVSALALCGCEKTEEPAPAAPKERPEVFVERLPNLPDGHPDLGGLKIESRSPRRLSVNQLERSIDALGNLPPGSVKLPADLAVTLGRPDFNRVTEESLEPSPLFMKFMLDLGGFACTSLSDLEPARPANQRLLTRYGSNVDANLRFMLLRFTGIEGAEADAHLPRLKAAYDRGALAGTRTLGGYEAVCMALFTSPEFLLY